MHVLAIEASKDGEMERWWEQAKKQVFGRQQELIV